MESELDALDRAIEQELKEIGEMTQAETESLASKRTKLDALNGETTVKMENELKKSEYYVNVRRAAQRRLTQGNDQQVVLVQKSVLHSQNAENPTARGGARRAAKA